MDQSTSETEVKGLIGQLYNYSVDTFVTLFATGPLLNQGICKLQRAKKVPSEHHETYLYNLNPLNLTFI